MGAFTITASPVAIYNEKKWRVDLLTRLSAAEQPTIFASVYGETKEVATMRAELTALAINRSTRNV